MDENVQIERRRDGCCPALKIQTAQVVDMRRELKDINEIMNKYNGGVKVLGAMAMVIIASLLAFLYDNNRSINVQAMEQAKTGVEVKTLIKDIDKLGKDVNRLIRETRKND